jgi:Mrp family chromosome partitioning ATPase
MIEPINFLGAIRQRWRLIVVCAVIGAIFGVLYPSSVTKHPKTVLKWQTTALVGAPASSGLIAGTVSSAQIQFYANTFPVKLAAVSDVGLTGNPYVFSGGMYASILGSNGKVSTKKTSGGNVTLYAAAQTPKLAADLANAYAQELGNTLEGVATSRQGAAASSGGKGSGSSSSGTSTNTGYQVLFPGTPQLAKRINRPVVSTLDSTKVRLLLGLAAGGIVALIIIVVRELLNKSIRRAGRAKFHFRFPVIAEIPETYPPAPGIVDVVDRPSSPAAESYRKLRMSILFEPLAPLTGAAVGGSDPFADLLGVSAQQAEPYAVPDEGSRSVLLFTSTTTEPSRPKVVANLAATYAEAGEKVIVISTSDLDSGSYIGSSGASTGPVTPADIEAALVPASPDGVSLLSFGHFMANSGQLVNRAGAVLTAAREVADVILIETPGFLAYHHAEALVHSVDAVVVICENGATQVPDAQDMGDVLRRLGAPVLGVTFTGEELSAEVRKALAGPKMVATKSKKPSKKKGDGAADEVAPDVVAGDDDLDAVELAASDAEHGDPAPTPELHPS